MGSALPIYATKGNKISLSWCKKNALGKPILLLKCEPSLCPSQTFFYKLQKKQLNKKKAWTPLHYQDEQTILNLVLLRLDNSRLNAFVLR
jgi:hypothetical protein